MTRQGAEPEAVTAKEPGERREPTAQRMEVVMALIDQNHRAAAIGMCRSTLGWAEGGVGYLLAHSR